MIGGVDGIGNGKIPDLAHADAIGRVVVAVVFQVVAKASAIVHVVGMIG